MFRNIFNKAAQPDSFIELKNFESPQVYKDVIQIFQNWGYRNPIIQGGALRDAYLGKKPRDIDVLVSLADFQHQKVYVPQYRQEYRASAVVKGTEVLFYDMDIEGIDYPIDLKIVNVPLSMEAALTAVDATMNSIAMDSSGKVIAHRQFEHDVNHQIYRLTFQHLAGIVLAPSRYRHFKKKFPELKFSI